MNEIKVPKSVDVVHLSSWATWYVCINGSTLRNLKTNFSLDLKTPRMFSNRELPYSQYMLSPVILNLFLRRTRASKLTAWSVGKSDIIKSNVSSKTGASYGFKAHLEKKVFILDTHFVEISRSAFTITDISDMEFY